MAVNYRKSPHFKQIHSHMAVARYGKGDGHGNNNGNGNSKQKWRYHSMVKQLPKPKLATLDDLFTTQEQRDDMQREKIMDIAIAEIDNFPNHS